MYNRNEYVDSFFQQILDNDEQSFYYFYNATIASFGKIIKEQLNSITSTKHHIVCFTYKRILVVEMDPAGGLSNNVVAIENDYISKIEVKKGLFSTKVAVLLKDNSTLMFKPNNSCVGLSNHKKGLEYLVQKYSV